MKHQFQAFPLIALNSFFSFVPAHNLKSDIHVHRHLGGLLVGLIRKLLLLWWWWLKRWRGCYCGGGEVGMVEEIGG